MIVNVSVPDKELCKTEEIPNMILPSFGVCMEATRKINDKCLNECWGLSVGSEKIKCAMSCDIEYNKNHENCINTTISRTNKTTCSPQTHTVTCILYDYYGGNGHGSGLSCDW